MKKMIWSKELLEAICADTDTIAEALRRLDLTPRGSNYKTFKRYVNAFGVDISHFVGARHSNRGSLLKAIRNKQKPLSEILVENSGYNSSALKKRLIKENVLPYECARCKINSWQNDPLSLHLDHINGNPIDHRISNLRFLCPNCHSQTDTYCGKKNRSVHLCKCGKKIGAKAQRCKRCSHRHRPTKIKWPPTEELIAMVKKRNYSAVGRLLGVTDNAIRKRIAKHPA